MWYVCNYICKYFGGFAIVLIVYQTNFLMGFYSVHC